MKTEVSKLTNDQIDWAVAVLQGVDLWPGLTDDERYSTRPELAMPIIEKYDIALQTIHNTGHRQVLLTNEDGRVFWAEGVTYIVAAMRVYIKSVYGDTVDIPEGI